jgi:hypothetical protein
MLLAIEGHRRLWANRKPEFESAYRTHPGTGTTSICFRSMTRWFSDVLVCLDCVKIFLATAYPPVYYMLQICSRKTGGADYLGRFRSAERGELEFVLLLRDIRLIWECSLNSSQNW